MGLTQIVNWLSVIRVWMWKIVFASPYFSSVEGISGIAGKPFIL